MRANFGYATVFVTSQQRQAIHSTNSGGNHSGGTHFTPEMGKGGPTIMAIFVRFSDDRQIKMLNAHENPN